MHRMEEINRKTWRNPLALRDYRRSSGYINDGEQVIMELAAEGAGQGRVLDIGVGGGRTAELLRPIAKTYVGIDYTAEMVTLARGNHPDLRFEHMDARDLSAFPTGSFDLVFFSYNGIDSVDPEGRLAVMREVSRVLVPGGAFVFSTFHRNWKGFAEPRTPTIEWDSNPLRAGFRMVKYMIGSVRARRFAPLEQRGGEHAILLHGAHEFGIMVYATTPQQLATQLDAAGFRVPPLLFDIDGEAIDGQDVTEKEYFHVVARKPSSIS